jgi:hypothetical protein
MTENEVIVDWINRVGKQFDEIQLSYAYEECSCFNIIEYEPIELLDNKKFAKLVWDFDTCFRTKFKNSDILISPPSKFHDMTNIIYEKKSEKTRVEILGSYYIENNFSPISPYQYAA